MYIGSTPSVGKYAVLDDISSSFDGTETEFTLTSGGTAIEVGNEANLEISISSVIQEPKASYTASGNKITFLEAPLSTDTFFGKVLGNVMSVGTPSDGTVSASSLSTSFFVKNSQTLSALSLTGSENALLVGTVEISGTIQIPDGATVVIL